MSCIILIFWTLMCITITICFYYVLQYYWSRRRLYALADKIKGPEGVLSLPIIGHAHLFLCKTEDTFKRINSVLGNSGKDPLKFWLGPYLIIAIKNPVHLEKIMSSTKFSYKHELYTVLETCLGDGLVSASGLKSKYKIHRRIIQPMLDLKFVESSLNIIHSHTDICMENLGQFLDTGTFDIHYVTEKYFMDVISEIILGQNINAQKLGLTPFCKAAIKMYTLGFKRIVNPLLYCDVIYNLLPDKAAFDQIYEDLYAFIGEIVIGSWKRRKLSGKQKHSAFTPIVDKMAEFIEANSGVISNEDFMSHLMTLFTAAADTLTIVSSFGTLCFGMCPEYQTRAAEEIRNVIGETPRHISLDDIKKLTYLDMCLKDINRLFPIAPYILKRTLADYTLDEWVIPKEAAILVSIFNVHRDKSYWEHPNEFYPDHFLPCAVKNRHVYAYMPFSAGPRGCIGKTLANIELKLFFCNLLQRFEIEADGRVPDIELKNDISVRPKYGYNCRLRKRIWK